MNKLAINGGKKLIENKPLGRPIVADESYPLINDMLKRGEISWSEVPLQLEKEFAEYVGAKYALCYCNGTTAIQASLFAAGVGAGDEVIVPSFTFWATVGPVVVNNAIPVFADVSLTSHNLTAQTIEPLITSKTKAILLVHVWGTPCEMDEIMALAKKYNLKVVTDCSHAHGSNYHGDKKGIIGDIAAFSLQSSKTMPGGEGGLLVTDDQEMYEKAVTLGHYERVCVLSDKYGYKSLDLTGAGFKHRINPLSAAIALGNLHRLDELNKIRNANAKRLENYLKELGYIEFQEVPNNSQRTYAYHYMRLIREKLGDISTSNFLKVLASEGIDCGSCGYGVLHKQPLYTGESPFGKLGPFNNPYWKDYVPNNDLPNTAILNATAFMGAPRFEYENEEYVERYAEVYKKLLDNLDELIKYDRENSDFVIKSKGNSINKVK